MMKITWLDWHVVGCTAETLTWFSEPDIQRCGLGPYAVTGFSTAAKLLREIRRWQVLSDSND